MRWLGILLGVFILVVSASAIDREAFTFTKYDLHLRVDPEQQRLEVRGEITLRNDSASPQSNLSLQISSSLHWSSIKIGGKPVEFIAQPYTSDIDHTGALSEAIVVLPHAVPPKVTIDLDIGYEGVVSSDTTRLERIGVPKEVAKQSDWDEIGKSFTAMRGIGYVAWYPVAMESASLSDASLFETLGRWKRREVQSDMKIALSLSEERSEEIPTIVCSGRVSPQTSETVGRPQHAKTECSFSPLGLAVPAFGAADYSILHRSSVTVYYLPEHKSFADNYALAAGLATPFVTEWFGAPRNEARVIELIDPQASPFESGSVLLTPLTKNISTQYDLIAVHQLTHAAFPSTRLWIYEGLAHFAQAMDIERKSGRQDALDFMASHRAAIVSAQKMLDEKHDPNSAASESLINTSIEEFYRSKAMYVWWMLRDMIGEKPLKQALANYDQAEDKDPSYMARLIETQANRDLEWFFDDWVYRDRRLPEFRVDSAYPRKMLKGGYMVTVTVENLGGAGAEVPLVMKMEDGEIRKRLEVRAKSKASVRFEATSIPQEIVVNDGSVPESDMSNNTYKIVLPSN